MRQRLPHAQRQRVLVAQPLPEARGAEPAVLVVYGRHAAGGGDAQSLAHRVHVLVVGNGELLVSEVPGGLLAEDPRRLAAVVPLDHAAGDIEVAAGERQRGRVEPERVVVVGEERGRSVARDGVERLLRRAASAHSASRQPKPRRTPPGASAPRTRSRASSSDVAPSRRTCRSASAQAREVHVRVREAGEHAAAAEVDDFGAGQRCLVRADAAGDSLAGDRERALHRHARIHRANDAVLEDHGRRHYRREEE